MDLLTSLSHRVGSPSPRSRQIGWMAPFGTCGINEPTCWGGNPVSVSSSAWLRNFFCKLSRPKTDSGRSYSSHPKGESKVERWVQSRKKLPNFVAHVSLSLSNDFNRPVLAKKREKSLAQPRALGLTRFVWVFSSLWPRSRVIKRRVMDSRAHLICRRRQLWPNFMPQKQILGPIFVNVVGGILSPN